MYSCFNNCEHTHIHTWHRRQTEKWKTDRGRQTERNSEWKMNRGRVWERRQTQHRRSYKWSTERRSNESLVRCWCHSCSPWKSSDGEESGLQSHECWREVPASSGKGKKPSRREEGSISWTKEWWSCQDSAVTEARLHHCRRTGGSSGALLRWI